MKLRKGDNVIILSGADKGKKGLITKVLLGKDRIVVEGVNARKKNMKPNTKQPHGGIIEFFAPINSSNAMLVCTSCSKPTRVAHKVTASGKIRICKKCNQATDTTTKKK